MNWGGRRMRLAKMALLAVLGLIVIYVVWLSESFGMVHENGLAAALSTSPETLAPKEEIVIAVVVCGMRVDETMNMLKSALLFNTDKNPLRFVIITEDALKERFKEKLEDWRSLTGNIFRYDLLPLTFPKNNEQQWKTLFKPCAAQRLFLPSMLSHLDSVLYVDTDILFLSPIADVWSKFRLFNATQIAALVPEHEDKNVGWYNRFARHPFYGPLGINSGVMLMNLTRLREFAWEEKIIPIYKEYKLKLTWGDQDLINILFYYHPDTLFVLPCEWNYRPDHCIYMSVCPAPSGIRIIHGNRGYFHSDKQPIFKYLFRSIEEYKLGDDPYRHFLIPLEVALRELPVVNSNCGQVIDKFLYKSRQIFKENFYEEDNN